jgi:hypothetical protein
MKLNLPNGVKALSGNLDAIKNVIFDVQPNQHVTVNERYSLQMVEEAFGTLARRVFNLDRCEKCGRWSKVMNDCGNCLWHENLKLKAENDTDKANLVAANERIAGLEKLVRESTTRNIKFHASPFIPRDTIVIYSPASGEAFSEALDRAMASTPGFGTCRPRPS